MAQVIEELRAAGVLCNQRGELWQVTPVGGLTYVLDVVGGRVRLALDYDGWVTCGTDAPAILATLARLESKRM